MIPCAHSIANLLIGGSRPGRLKMLTNTGENPQMKNTKIA